MFQIQPRKIMCTYHFAHIFISFLFCFSLILIFSESELFFQMSIKEKSWKERKMKHSEVEDLVLFTKKKHF